MQFDEEYFKSEEFQELLERYEDAIATGSGIFMDADDLTDIADYYSYSGDAEKAMAAIDYALDLYPQATLPNVFKARDALIRQAFDEAADFADRIEDKDSPDYHYLIAEILIAQNKTDEADRYLRDYFRSIPADEHQDFVLDAANLYIDYGVNDKAYEWMMRSKGDDSDDFKEIMARTLFGLGKYKDSERLFNELLDRNPFSKYYWNALASAQFMDEDYSGSVTSSEYAIALDPNDPESVSAKANGLFRLGNYEEAANYFHRYTELEPDDEFGPLHEGVCLVNLGRFDEALKVLKLAADISPKDSEYLPQICQEIAFCYSAMRKPDDALEWLDKTRDMDCDHIDVIVIRGHILLENERIEEAEQAFRLALIRSDSSPQVMLRIMVSLYDNHCLRACYSMFKKFFSVVGSDFNEGYSYMALCCYELGYDEEFLMYLRLACEYNPREARQVLGELFPEGMAAKEYYSYMRKKLKQ